MIKYCNIDISNRLIIFGINKKTYTVVVKHSKQNVRCIYHLLDDVDGTYFIYKGFRIYLSDCRDVKL